MESVIHVHARDFRRIFLYYINVTFFFLVFFKMYFSGATLRFSDLSLRSPCYVSLLFFICNVISDGSDRAGDTTGLSYFPRRYLKIFFVSKRTRNASIIRPSWGPNSYFPAGEYCLPPLPFYLFV